MQAWRDNEQVKDLGRAVSQVFVRSAGFYAVGAGAGVLLGLARSANVTHYALHVGTNCFLVALACFTPREVMYRIPPVNAHVPDSVCSSLSGALGGFAVMRVFSGTTRQGVKGALAFGLCGFVLEKANTQFLDWKLTKRDALMEQQNKKWTPSPWQERQAGLAPNPMAKEPRENV